MKVTRSDLRSLIRKPYSTRGETEFTSDDVTFVKIEEEYVEATVEGTMTYSTVLHRHRTYADDIGGDCTCPSYRDNGPCKHMMALGLALIEHYNLNDPTEVKRLNGFREKLKKMSKEDLVETIVKISSKHCLRDILPDAPLVVNDSSTDDDGNVWREKNQWKSRSNKRSRYY